METPYQQRPVWQDQIPPARHAWHALAQTVETDVVVIGAGITGLSTAWHLLESGMRVVVLEAGKVGQGTTGSSTGNLYVPVGARLHAIAAKHGKHMLRNVVEARIAGLNFIEARIVQQNIACDFRRVPFFLFSAPDDEAGEEVRQEFVTASQLGLAASDAIASDFPFPCTALTTLENQAQFNPLRYALGLAEALSERGCAIHENSRVLTSVDGDRCTVGTASGNVIAQHIVKATHVPQGLYAVHAAMIPSREYAVLARVNDEALPPGIYWNANPAWRYSIRSWQSPDGNFVMVLGEPHKPGEQDPAQLDRIMRFLRGHFSVREITHVWAAQNYRPADLLPYIGNTPAEKHTWSATGFAADGLAWGSFAAQVISEGIRGVESRWSGLFDPHRFTPLASAKNAMKETAAVSRHLLQDFLSYGRNSECGELAPGAGRVINVEGEKIAVCRDRAGELHVVSAVCTHMGCLVHWNQLEQSWDCPCHGSRFSMEGAVLEGPAPDDLAIPRPAKLH